MDLYVDTANSEKVCRCSEYGLIDGVTTNPSIVASAGVSYREAVDSLANLIEGPVFAQVISDDRSDMIAQAETYSEWYEEIVVKIPATRDGYSALRDIRNKGIDAGITAVFSVPQAILAAKNNANFVAPYVGSLSDIGRDGVEVALTIQKMFNKYSYDTNVLAAGIQNNSQATRLYQAGIDAITLKPALFESQLNHTKTEENIANFRTSWENRTDPPDDKLELWNKSYT